MRERRAEFVRPKRPFWKSHGKDHAKVALAHVVLSMSEVGHEHTQKRSLLNGVDNCGQYDRAIQFCASVGSGLGLFKVRS